MSPPILPVPARTRWQPLRLGLVDLFLYDHAEFKFRDGHLLLRGNNGTGKSKVLALTLPFLLDGELAAARVEPDGEAGKRMEWNLLLGGRHDERLGYTWLEFGRRDDTGAALFITLGCGLKAVSGRGIVDRWFFVAPGRVGADFGLVGATGVAHTRERLTETLDGIGHVYRRAEDYRRAIDERLFRLGLDRYEALINLLIQLRQPQLSRRPDEDKLSRALSEALRPVDQAILSVVAEAFHDLEQQREELRDLRETHVEVGRFLQGYRRYAAVAARRLAQDVRSGHSVFQACQRQLAETRLELDRAEADDQGAARQRAEVGRELAAARGLAAELRDSREVRDLDAAERLLHMADNQARQAALVHDEGTHDVDQRRGAVEATLATAVECERALQDLFAQIDRAAGAAGLSSLDRELLPRLSPESDHAAEEASIRTAEVSAATEVRRRTEAVQHVRGLIARSDEAIRQLEAGRGRLHQLIAERDASNERLALTLQQLADAVTSLINTWREYLGSLIEIVLPDPERLLAEIESWAESLDGPDPGAATVAELTEVARNTLSQLRAGAQVELQQRNSDLQVLVEERERLLRGEVLAPPAPYMRDPKARERRAGAPLWQLVDFRADVPDQQRAGLEAGLEAAGILDAWVTPDGQLLALDTHDVIVLAGRPVENGSSLLTLLAPAIDRDHPQAAAVDETTVQRILAGIGVSAGVSDVWVDPSGRWRQGVLEGNWSKSAPAFIGRGARDAARRRRLAELAVEIARADEAVNAARAELTRFETRQTMLSADLGRRPETDALRGAHRAVVEARQHVHAAEAQVLQIEVVVAHLQDQAGAALSARDDASIDLKLPAHIAALDGVSQAIADYREAVAGVWPRARAQVERLDALHTGQQLLGRAEEVAAERAAKAEAASRAAQEERGRWEGVRASIGATVEHIRSRFASVSARIRTLEDDDRRLDELRLECGKRIGRAQGSQVRLEAELVDLGERRARAVEALQRFASSGLLIAAVPGLQLPTSGWAPDPAARLARRVEQSLETTDADDQTWERIRREFTSRFKELQDSVALRGHSATLDLGDGWHVVSITFHGQQRSPDDLVARLADEVEHRDRLLNARERELLEEHLVNEVASHLHELIHEAELQVQYMNEELKQRPTSTGMRLRFRWMPRPDGPTGLVEARGRLLRQVHDAWSVEDRAAVSAFLKEQIDRVRNANLSGTWLEHLTEAFDYRRWHRFSIERFQDGHWRAATGPASSGERVLTVTLPLFAAASAHYRSAHPTAPRLVMLDEVFAGVDDDSRSKSIGLLDTFDLDFMMTSEREWGCYATLPGLAIYQLARREGIDAVHVTAWTWDGHARSLVEEAPSTLSLPPVGTNGHVRDLNGR